MAPPALAKVLLLFSRTNKIIETIKSDNATIEQQQKLIREQQSQIHKIQHELLRHVNRQHAKKLKKPEMVLEFHNTSNRTKRATRSKKLNASRPKLLKSGSTKSHSIPKKQLKRPKKKVSSKPTQRLSARVNAEQAEVSNWQQQQRAMRALSAPKKNSSQMDLAKHELGHAISKKTKRNKNKTNSIPLKASRLPPAALSKSRSSIPTTSESSDQPESLSKRESKVGTSHITNELAELKESIKLLTQQQKLHQQTVGEALTMLCRTAPLGVPRKSTHTKKDMNAQRQYANIHAITQLSRNEHLASIVSAAEHVPPSNVAANQYVVGNALKEWTLDLKDRHNMALASLV